MNIKNKKLCFRKRRGCSSSFFTIIELIAAMAVFAVIMLVMMKFFGSAQKAWTGSAAKSQIFEDAKLAMEMMSRDLQSAIYVQNITPFANYSGEDRIALISATSMKQNDKCLPTSEVQYKLDPSDGFLYRSVIGNKNDDGSDNTYSSANPAGTFNYMAWPSPISDPFNDADWHEVIPYVTELEFKTYRMNGSVLEPILESDTDFTNFPKMVIIKMSLIDKNSYLKWQESGNDDIKTASQRTFTKMIFLGDQGQ